jgi:hypothetical protein
VIGFGIWLFFAVHYGGYRKYVKCAICTALAAFCAAGELYVLRPQPQPSDERRDEQGKPEQLVGPGDDPNDRDDG